MLRAAGCTLIAIFASLLPGRSVQTSLFANAPSLSVNRITPSAESLHAGTSLALDDPRLLQLWSHLLPRHSRRASYACVFASREGTRVHLLLLELNLATLQFRAQAVLEAKDEPLYSRFLRRAFDDADQNADPDLDHRQ